MNETSPAIYFQLTPVWQVVAVLCALLLALGSVDAFSSGGAGQSSAQDDS